MSCPVVWLEHSESRNAVVFAISSAVVIRFPNGIFDSISASFAFGFGNVWIHFSYRGVQHSATIISFTRMPYLSMSTAHSSVHPFRNSFAAAYAHVQPCTVYYV